MGSQTRWSLPLATRHAPMRGLSAPRRVFYNYFTSPTFPDGPGGDVKEEHPATAERAMKCYIRTNRAVDEARRLKLEIIEKPNPGQRIEFLPWSMGPAW